MCGDRAVFPGSETCGTARVVGEAVLEVHSTVMGALFGNFRCVMVFRKPPLGKRKVFKIKKQVTKLTKPG